MEPLKLIRPNEYFEKQVLGMVHEFYDDNTTPYWSSWLKKFLDNYSWWLEYLKNCEKDHTWDEKLVPGIQYILVRESDDSVIWFINTRLRLNNALLEHGWHIGYSIRPSERGKHYATAQLFSVLKLYQDLWIEKVLLTCDKSNIWSAKTIQNCGWILENEIIDPSDWQLIQRYWIDVNEWIGKWNDFFENCGLNIEIL